MEVVYLYHMPLATRILPNYTYEEYCMWAGRWELIGGIPYAKTPAPSPRHQHIASELNVSLHNAIAEVACKCSVYHPIDIKIDEHNVLQPDVLIVCKPIAKLYLDFPPELVVEILSPSTRDKDLITKHELYGTFGVKYYLIIDPENNKIICNYLDNGVYLEVPPPYQFKLKTGCTISPDFNDIFE